MRTRFIAPSRRLAVLAALACASALLSVPTLATSADAAARPARVSSVRVSSRSPNAIAVYWSKAKRASRYQVLVSRNARMTGAKGYTTSARSRIVKGVNPAVSHCIQVRGISGKRTFGRRSAVRCTVGRASTPWVDRQEITPTTSEPRAKVRLRWRALAGATAYEIDYALSPTGEKIEVQTSPQKRSMRVAGPGSGLMAADIGGLTPGGTYCFQVRGQGRAGNGMRGARRCKVVMTANRARTAQTTPLVVGTFNTCSSEEACSKKDGWASWANRRPLVAKRILEMRLPTPLPASDGTQPLTGPDVVAIQEGINSTDAMKEDLRGTFVEGCRSERRLQSLFVRSSTYAVVSSNTGSTFDRFADDKSHGACWARIRNRATQREVIVASVHLMNGKDAANDIRRREMDFVVSRIQSAEGADVPIVFAGDFNSHRSRTVDAPRVELAKIGAEDAFDQAATYLSPPYLSSVCPTATPCASWMWGDHVDRVFVTERVHVGAWKVDYRLNSAGNYVRLSDHNPVLVSLLIP